MLSSRVEERKSCFPFHFIYISDVGKYLKLENTLDFQITPLHSREVNVIVNLEPIPHSCITKKRRRQGGKKGNKGYKGGCSRRKNASGNNRKGGGWINCVNKFTRSIRLMRREMIEREKCGGREKKLWMRKFARFFREQQQRDEYHICCQNI